MRNKSFKIIIFLSFFILFSATLYNYLTFNLWDFDFWWHIATGRYILTEGHLLEKDPFSFTSTMEENKNPFPERENFILKQYWLAQILFYIIFDNTGPTGIILFRSIMLLLTVLIVYWQLYRSGVNFYISFVIVFILFMVSMRALGERPVLFSILFASVVLFLLEDFKDRKTKTLFWVAPVMLLWGNMHGGFILGVIIVSVYMFGTMLKIFFKKSDLTKKEMIFFYSATSLALFASFINPIGWDAFFIAFSSKYDVFLKGIQEYESPLYFYMNKVRTFDYPYFSLALMFPLILILRNRKMELIHLILLSGFLIMSLKATRYGVFYGIVGSMIMGKEYNAFINEKIKKRVPEGFLKKIEYGLAVVCLISASFFIAGYFDLKYIKFDVAKLNTIPVETVDFMERNKIKGNMYNDYGYGGYITWRLYPVKNFIDTRSLNITVMNEYYWVATAVKKVGGIKTKNDNVPLWETLLNHYKINYIVLSWMDVYGHVIPVIYDLAESDKWVPIYLDPVSIIFIRNTPDNKDMISKYKITKDNVYNGLVAKNAISAMNDEINPRYFVTLGDVFLKTGRTEDALKAYKYALERFKDPELEKKIKEIDGEFEKQNKQLDKSSDKNNKR